MSNPFYFLPVEEEEKKANDAYDTMLLGNKTDTDNGRINFLYGWMRQNYKDLFEYLKAMQEESKD